MEGYIEKHGGGRVGDDALGAVLVTALRQLAKRGGRRRTRGGGGGRLGEDDEIGAEEAIGEDDEREAEAADVRDAREVDDEIGRIEDEANEIGARGGVDNELKKLNKMRDGYQNKIDDIDRKLIKMPKWRRPKAKRLNKKRDELDRKLSAVKEQIQDLKARQARENARGGGGRGAGAPDGGGGGGGGAYPQGGGGVMRPDGTIAVYGTVPPERQNNELPITFEGEDFALITLVTGSVAGSKISWSGVMSVPSYMRVRIKGIKITAHANKGVITYSDPNATTTYVVATTPNETHKAWINVEQITPDGSFNLVMKPFTANMADPTFAASNEYRMTDGMRKSPIIESKTDVDISGNIQVPFTITTSDFLINMKAALIVDLLWDTNQDGPFPAYMPNN